MKINSFYPVVMTKDVKECADFFIQYFDFGTTFESDWYISLIDENNNELAILDYQHETVPSGFGLPLSGLLLNMEVDNVDEVYDRLRKDLTGRIVLDIKSEAFGQRHFIIEGPSKMLSVTHNTKNRFIRKKPKKIENPRKNPKNSRNLSVKNRKTTEKPKRSCQKFF